MAITPGRWAVAALIAAAPLVAQTVPVTVRTLPNGLRLLMVERHDQPVISCGWVVKVGSVNERPGITGISHMLEHMMKKGTKVVGTRDAAKDQELNARQDKIWAEIRKEEEVLRVKQLRGEIADMYDPKVRSERHQRLLEDYNKLVKELAEITVVEEYDKLYRTAGAVGRNAFTGPDLTGHIITIPSNKLEMYTWMESDRLLNAQFRAFYSERDVVRDERRGAVESRPIGRAQEAFEAAMWEGHPYSWSVIGHASDISSYSREQLQDYFSTYYVPDNISFVLVGDLNPEETFKLFERYFSRVPANPRGVPPMVTLEPKPIGEKRISIETEFTPLAFVGYKTVAVAHKDDPALTLLAAVLNGNSGRLNTSLVLEKKVATNAGAGQDSRRFGGALTLRAAAAPGQKPEDVEKALIAEIEKIQKDGITDQELQKVKNQALAESYRRLTDADGLREQLLSAESTDTLQYFQDQPNLQKAVTREDIQRVARLYLTRENRTVGLINRKASSGPEDPEIAKLPEQMRDMVKAQLSQLGKVTDVAKLKEIAGRMEGQAGQVPAEMKAGFDYLLKKLRERIVKMEAK